MLRDLLWRFVYHSAFTAGIFVGYCRELPRIYRDAFCWFFIEE